jgi:hypothetical protein
MRWMRYLALVSFVLPLSGCVTNFAPPLNGDIVPSGTSGVIAGEFSRTAPTGVAFIVHNTKTNAEYALSLGENSRVAKDVTQQVIAIDVPPGDYVISQWETFDLLTKKLYGQFVQSISQLATPFTVRAGQVTFLGSYYVSGSETYSRREETTHWRVVPQTISFNDAHVSFVVAYPAYSKSEFACLQCTETLIGSTRVKDVMKDPHAYVVNQFGLSAMTPEVMSMIRASDNEPVHFSRIVMHLTWQFSSADPSKTSTVDEVRTLINEGGPFVEALSERSRSGVPIGPNYAMTYRNMLYLKNQRIDILQEFAPPPTEIKLVERFDPISSIDSGAQYAFSIGSHGRANNSATSVSCTSEGRQAASTFNPSFMGDGIKLACNYYNANSVLTSTSRFIYLPRYGVGVPLSVQSAQGRNEAKLTAVTIE